MRSAARFPAVRVEQEFILFNGGMDVVTPNINIPPGFVRKAQNREQSINGGYTRILGNERSDGRPSPSDANYAIISITLTGTIAVGNTVTGGTSAATGVVVALTSTSLILTKVTGTFVTAEALQVAAVTQATSTSAAIIDGAATPLLHAQYKNLAADQYRADILAVPGSGGILGVSILNDVRYAWRNNAGGTAAVMHKQTAAGWVAVTLYNQVSFTAGGTATPADGATLTQGAVTATVQRVVLQSGAWTGSAAGRFIVTNPSGGNFAAGAATLTGGATVTLSGIQTAISFAVPSGRFEFVNANFGGAANTTKMYGVDGKNKGFEFDGTTLVPIVTGMTTDTPKHITAHNNHLFFSFDGSVQHSAPGTPYIWSAVVGAGELAMGDTVTGFKPQPGNQTVAALAIFTRNKISMLYGTGVSNWNLVDYKQEAGAYAYTIQHMATTLMFDDRGITTLEASQVYGNFADATISQRVRTWLNERRTKAVASMVIRDKNQYRLFFTDRSALYVTMSGKKVAGMMPVVLGQTPTCAYSGELNDGSEVAYFGGSDGYVYQMEKGTSFDGDAIEEYMHFVFNSSKSPRTIKHYRHCATEVSGSGYAEFNFSYELGYATTNIDQPGSEAVITNFSAVNWDSFTWDAFIWDGQTLMPSEIDMRGDAENVSLIFSSNSDYFASTTLSGAIISFSPRRSMR